MTGQPISAVWMGKSPSQVTAEVTGEFGSLDAPGAVEELTRRLENYQRMDATLARGELSRTAADPKHASAADEHDSMAREGRMRMDFAAAVGRPPYPWEIAGPPREGCVACRRLSGAACEEHTRRPGVDPLPYPPRAQWVERSHLPGVQPIPYDVLNSVRQPVWGPASDDLACGACGGALMGWHDACPCGHGRATWRELLRPAEAAGDEDTPELRRMTWQEAMSILRRRYVGPS